MTQAAEIESSPTLLMPWKGLSCDPLIEPNCIPVVPTPTPGGTDSIDDPKALIYAPDANWEGTAGFGEQLRP